MIVKCSGGGSDEASAEGSAVAPQQGPVVQVLPQQQVTAPSEQPFAREPNQPAPQLQTGAAASALERALRARRLWSTVDVSGSRIEVRSASCDDPAMAPTVEGIVPTLRSAGLTRLRCLAQSGSVVFERDL